MRSNFKPILLSLLAIIFLSAIISFFYREEIWLYLSKDAEIGLENIVYSSEVSAKDVIDLEILKSETLNSLKQQVSKFDYNNICYRPAIRMQTTEGVFSQTQASCSLGSGIPFLAD